MATWGPGGVQGGEVKQIDLADIFNRAEDIRNKRMQNRLAQMQMENENKRRAIMQNSIIPAQAAQPQQGTPAQPAYGPNAATQTMPYTGQNVNALTLTQSQGVGGGMSPVNPAMANTLAPASPDYQPAQAAQPAGFDYQGAQNQLMQAGLLKDAIQMRQLRQADIPIMAQIGDIAQKNGAAAGAMAWKQAGFDTQYGDFQKFYENGVQQHAGTEWDVRTRAAQGDATATKVLDRISAEKAQATGNKTPSDYGTFYSSQKAVGKTDAEISQAWHKMKTDEAIQIGANRIPAFQGESNLPPDVVRNRRDGKLYRTDYDTGKLVPYKPTEGNTVASESAGYTANKDSLKNIVKGKDTIMAFEKGVSQSLDLVETLSKDIKRGAIPGINRISQVIAYQGGNPKIKAFKNAIMTAMTEYMKVTTAGTGISTAELTQGAQTRAKEMLDAADNVKTLKNSIDVYRQEMAIKKNAFNAQEAEVRARLAGGATAAPIGGNKSDPLGLR